MLNALLITALLQDQRLTGCTDLATLVSPAHGCALCHGVADVVISAHARAPTPTHTHAQPAGTVGCVELKGSHE